MTQVMKGVRVLEVAQFIFAPSAGALLADWGADVVKIEHPVYADGQRGFIRWSGVTFDPDRNPLIEGCNRGKRSVGLDISKPEGREVLYELAKSADVFLTNYLPSVREKLLDRQRRFAGQAGGAVLDGRDIGTVIAPDADVKLFVTASVEVRARRRVAELLARGMPAHLEDVVIDLKARDARDSTRDAAPLAAAEDALLLDTSGMDVEEAVAEAIGFVEKRLRDPAEKA